MFVKDRPSVRISEEVKQKARELIKRFPDDYPSISQVVRSGVMRLYDWRMKEVKK